MKNTFKNITSVLMILVLLVSTLQLSIYKMECLMSGNVKVSLTDFEDCNKSKKDDCSLNEICCCFHQMDLNFDYDTDFSDKIITNIPFISINFIETLECLKIISQDFNFFTNLPPPSGFDLLKIVQVFRL